jgi:APA family basic amino acid/polyamine antiporter
MLPHAGGVYVYLREAYSSLFGFLYGWTFFIVIQCGTIAAVGVAFAKFSGVILPWITEDNILLRLGQFEIDATQFVAVMMVLFLTWINTLGIREGKRVQNTFTYLKVLILLAFIIIGIYAAKETQLDVFKSPDFWKATKAEGGQQIPLVGFGLIAAIGMAMVGSLFSADAWYNITFTSDEVINPRKTIVRSLILGTIVVCVLYFFVNVVYILALPVRGIPDGTTVLERGMQFASEDRIATAAVYGILGQRAEVYMAIAVVISTFGCNNGMVLAGARVIYAMARDKLFFRQTGILNKKGVPGVALWVQATWSIMLCFSGTYNQLLDYVIFAALIFYVLVIAAIFVLRYKKPTWERPYRAFGFPVIPIIYMLACLLIIAILLIYKPLFTWPGPWPVLIIILSGIPVFHLWRKFSSSKKTEG